MACTATAFTPDQYHLPLPDGEQIVFTCDLSKWELYNEEMGRLVRGDDFAIILEMFEAAEEERNKELDRKIRIIGEALEAMNQCEYTEWYRRSDSWNDPERVLPCNPSDKDGSEFPLHRVWAHLMLWPLDHFDQGDEIVEALQCAEEDYHYEQWINSKQYVKSLEEYNRHKLLACDCSNRQWVGKYTEENTFSAGNTFLRTSYLLDRYKMNSVVRNPFPDQWGNHGYAVASSDYGDIYIPNKFNGYVGQPGSPVTMTVALQDVGGGGRKGNGFRWTCIYIH
jgi:hypothetical protein